MFDFRRCCTNVLLSLVHLEPLSNQENILAKAETNAATLPVSGRELVIPFSPFVSIDAAVVRQEVHQYPIR